VPVDEYLEALAAEFRIRLPHGSAATLDTVYFGGGTPSKLGAGGVARALDLVRAHATLAPDAEVTLEANPEDITAAAAEAWLRAGVNRLSIGSQTFDDAVLRWMHRTHDAAAIGASVAAARSAGFSNYSLDLIFALPDAVARDWPRDVDAALELEPAHLSLYGLTVEPHTPLGRWRARGSVAEAPEETYEWEFMLAHRALSAAGFEHYEVSNFARPGLRSRHNAAYWTGAPYVGIGPSAHGFDGRRRQWNASGYVEWLGLARAGRDPEQGGEELTAENRLAEEVYLGLRTGTGLRLRGAEMEHTRSWVAQGWGELSAEANLRLTPHGWLRLDALAADLTLFRSRY